ncbi:MAG: Rne/Rng family ribonuclease [Clostridia bacterium]|nr:Rne/Rng family ribonuclease [Clostridia bacterium]
MKKEWFFDRYCGQQFVALVEDGKVVEFAVEKEESGCIVGNIYKGKVTNVLSGMNAAFINCGLGRNCYLSTEETYTDYSKYEGMMGAANPALHGLKEGDEIIVQVTKPPRGTKGAKVTTHLSFVGKRIIYLPNTDFLGVSRKIVDEAERERLLGFTDTLRKKGECAGFIFRTQAPLATVKELKKEVQYLRNLYLSMLENAKRAPVGTVLYQDEDLPVRVMRDSLGDEISAMHVGDIELYERLKRLAKLREDIPERKLVLYKGERSMLREYGISDLAYDATKPRVPLEGGGTIVIDHTEAMTVIDVNSGSFVGENNLEETVFAVNLQAAKEIARQVRLRNIGGIVVVDFIDMFDEAHKTAVTDALRTFLEKDKAKCNVLPMSELGLVQFTRKRVGNELSSYLVKPCPHCHGNGSVHDDLFMMTQIRADLMDCFADGYRSAVVELNDGMARKILQEGIFSKEMNGRWKGRQIYLIPHKTYKEHHFSVRGENDRILTLPDNAQLLY